MLDIKRVNKFSLAQACQYVIQQNKDVDYIPTRFIQIINRAIAEKNLEERISELVLNAELLEELEGVIKKYPRLITIEDLITAKSDHFNLADDVVLQAKGRSEYFNNMRLQISNINLNL